MVPTQNKDAPVGNGEPNTAATSCSTSHWKNKRLTCQNACTRILDVDEATLANMSLAESTGRTHAASQAATAHPGHRPRAPCASATASSVESPNVAIVGSLTLRGVRRDFLHRPRQAAQPAFADHRPWPVRATRRAAARRGGPWSRRSTARTCRPPWPLGEARGVALFVAGDRGLPCRRLCPGPRSSATIRSAMAAASKSQVAFLVRALLSMRRAARGRWPPTRWPSPSATPACAQIPPYSRRRSWAVAPATRAIVRTAAFPANSVPRKASANYRPSTDGDVRHRRALDINIPRLARRPDLHRRN